MTICIPEYVANAIYNDSHGKFFAGERLTYSCDTGYTHVAGNLNRTCHEDGEWDGDMPVCKSKYIYLFISNT